MPELDSFLQTVCDQGEFDSTGVFTFDAKSAREKLKRYQFAHPGQYVLLILASASHGGATYLNAQVRAHRCSFTFDGAPLPLTTLGSALQLADGLPQDPGIRSLALAVLGAEGLKPETLVVESFEGTEQTRLWVEEHGWRLEREPLNTSENRIELVFSPAGKRRRALKALVAALPEQLMMVERACLANMSITINGSELKKPMVLEKCQMLLALGEVTISASDIPTVQAPAAGDYIALLGLGTRTPGIRMVTDGVWVGNIDIKAPVLDQTTWQGNTGAGGIVHTEGLTRDLGGALVKNHAFKELCLGLSLDLCFLTACAGLADKRQRKRCYEAWSTLSAFKTEEVAAWPARYTLRWSSAVLVLGGLFRRNVQSGYTVESYLALEAEQRLKDLAHHYQDLADLAKLEKSCKHEEMARLFLLLEAPLRVPSGASGVRLVMRLSQATAEYLQSKLVPAGDELLASVATSFQRMPVHTLAEAGWLMACRASVDAALRPRAQVLEARNPPEPIRELNWDESSHIVAEPLVESARKKILDLVSGLT